MAVNRDKKFNLRTAVFAVLGALACSQPLHSADLTIGDGVIVKMESETSLVVRDALHAGKGVTFTSTKDDSVGGQTGVAAGTPAQGDWNGIKVEASVAAASLKLDDVTLRYAGGASGAALSIRKTSPAINYLNVFDSLTGVRVTNGAAPLFTGLTLKGNGTGLEVDTNAIPTVSNSQILSNTVSGISNLTPTSVITATGNWWGDASGPKDSVGNPNGTGDVVSAGVNYSGWATVIPLINSQISVAGSPNYTEQSGITLNLACRNAVEYRVAENGDFTNKAFLPMVASVPFTLSSGDGIKQLSVQYRASTGNIATSSLTGGIIYDTQGPTLNVTNPAAGSFLTKAISIDATASDPSGVTKVEFYIDNVLKAPDSSAPYSYAWDVTTETDGNHDIKVIAYDAVGHSTVDTRTISKGVPPADTAGPAVVGIKLGSTGLVDGATITRSASIALSASDPSGVGHVDFLLDGVVFASVTSNYSGYLDLFSTTDGNHVLSIKAYDSLNNMSQTNFNIVVALAAPAAPSITMPANGLLTSQKQIAVTGTAEKQTQVQLYSNSIAVGSPIAVDANGNYSATLTLNDGANQIQAAAINRGGTGPMSGVVLVTIDSSIPLAPTGLSALAQPGGKIHLSWLKSSDIAAKGYNVYRSPLAFNSITEATKANSVLITGTAYDDLPPTDGTYNYRVVAANALGTPSLPSNQVSAISDNTLPRAVSIAYAPTGKVDNATGRIAQGRVYVTVTVSEPLLAAPFLSIAPPSGTPISIDLTKSTETEYKGYFDITANTASGLAYAVFSARDLIGNRGTDIVTGGSIKIDAEGPALTGISLVPGDPLKNDAANPLSISASFTLNEAMKSGQLPQFSYVLSKAGRTLTSIPSVTQTGPMDYQASFTLPADAGQTEIENLQFSYQGMDDLDNVSTKVLAANRFQVYQGNLPPSGVPLNFAAQALPAGKVKLSWNAVDDVIAYQLYRQAPGEGALTAYQRVTGINFTDSTVADGAYHYAIASVRSHNSQEALSAASATVEAIADATLPDAPTNLSLSLTGAGIKALWLAPAAADVVSYNVYRSSQASITSLTGLTPIRTGIKQLGYIDATPSLAEHSYVATAVDAAGNESPMSNSAYLNFALLPVNTLTVVQSEAGLPVITWTHTAQTIAGYDVLLGPDASPLKLNSSLLTAKTYTDNGYAGDERRYTVVAWDTNSAQVGRSIVLPKLSAQLASGTPLKRGIMNRLQYQVTNSGASAVDNIMLKVKAASHDHSSASFSLSPGETKTIPVIVGGYTDLPSAAALTTTIQVTPNEGELVQIVRTANADVLDGSLTLGLTTEAFTRGATGKVSFTLANTSDVDMEIVTATSTGNQPSNEMRFKLIDSDNNVLATQAFKQFVGNVVTLANGKTVARIPAGSTFTSDPVSLAIPGAAPTNIQVEMGIDFLHYHTGQADEVNIQGMSSRQAVSLLDTAYYAEVSSITPLTSFGDRDIVITGRAVDRQTSLALPNVPLKLVFRVNGFERKFDLYTGNDGAFSYSFKPQASDAGIFKVSVVHPDLLDRPDQGQFVINQVVVTPNQITLNTPRNYNQLINLSAVAGDGTTASNVRVVYDAQYQPTGSLPQGVTVGVGSPVSLTSKQRVTLPITISADNTANETGAIVLKVLSDEHGTDPIGNIRVDYRFSDAKAAIYPSPSYVETGVAQNHSVTEQVTLENRGLAAAANVNAVLQNASGGPAPDWITLTTPGSLGSINVGEKKTLDIVATPSGSVAEGIYTFKLHVTGDNIAGGDVNLFVSVTQNGVGNVLFKVSDIYTATLDKNNRLIPGLAGARIRVQNEQVASIDKTLTSDSLGEAFFTNLAAGNYKFRATATNHQEVAGRFSIKPGITTTQDIFLDYNLVTVEWSVKEITIQDKYEITLNATYETDVPAAVVVLEPANVNLPKMKPGDVFLGEFTLTNYGLVRADNIKAQLPAADQYMRYEFLIDIPASLDAKQRLTIPYRAISLKSFEPDGTASGGGCYDYSNRVWIPYNYTCANGKQTNGSTGGYWSYTSNTVCSGGGGGGGGATYGGGGGGGGGFGGGGPSYSSVPGAQCIPGCTNCCPVGNGPK